MLRAAFLLLILMMQNGKAPRDQGIETEEPEHPPQSIASHAPGVWMARLRHVAPCRRNKIEVLTKPSIIWTAAERRGNNKSSDHLYPEFYANCSHRIGNQRQFGCPHTLCGA